MPAISRYLLPGLVALCLLTPSEAQRPQVRWNAPPQEWTWNIPEKIPGIVHGTTKSQSMQREVGYNVWLPPGYETAKEKRYPVVYYLHGASGSELSAIEMGDLVKRLHRQGKIGDVLYVFPNGGHFSRYRDWEEGNVKAEIWIVKELVPHIDQTYRTIAKREGRASCGWSMGGDGALRFACQYPDLFCAAASFSAAIDWGADRDGSDGIAAHCKTNLEKIRGKTGLLLVVDENDDLFKNYQRLLPELDKLKIPYEFQSLPGVGHNLGAIKAKYGETAVLMLAKNYAPAK